MPSYIKDPLQYETVLLSETRGHMCNSLQWLSRTECRNVNEATPDEEEWEEDANLFERLFWVVSQGIHYLLTFLLEK